MPSAHLRELRFCLGGSLLRRLAFNPRLFDAGDGEVTRTPHLRFDGHRCQQFFLVRLAQVHELGALDLGALKQRLRLALELDR